MTRFSKVASGESPKYLLTDAQRIALADSLSNVDYASLQVANTGELEAPDNAPNIPDLDEVRETRFVGVGQQNARQVSVAAKIRGLGLRLGNV